MSKGFLLSLYWDDGRREIEQFSKDSTAPAKGKTTSYNQLTTVSAQDVIRVVMAYAFDRARLKYGYKLLRGADFDKKGAVDDNLRVQRFNTLKEKLPDVLDVHSWHEFIKAIMNAGYLSGDLILSGNAIFYTYALYLIAKHRFNASYNENMHLILDDNSPYTTKLIRKKKQPVLANEPLGVIRCRHYLGLQQ